MTLKNETAGTEQALTFGPLEEKWLDQMAALERDCFSLPWSREALANELKREDAPYVICFQGKTLLGYIGCRIAIDEGEITNVAVSPQARRRGVGRRMLDQAMLLLKNRGVRQVFLEVRESNLPAQRLYEQAGFVPVGRRRHYYIKPEEDALLLGRELI